MSSISRAQVAHLAMLARIEMSEDELFTLAGELEGILDAVERVREAASEVASGDVPPMGNPVPMDTALRPDTPHAGLSQQAALAGAPEAEDGRFVVPRILGED